MGLNTTWSITFLIPLFILSCAGQSDTGRSSGENAMIVENPEYGIWQNSTTSPVSFDLEQVFGAETEDEGVLLSNYFSITGPVSDTSGNIYMADRGTSKLFSFSNNGILNWKTGQKGEGPGDFMNPRGMATDGQFLFLGNNGGSRIDKFDLQGNFVESLTWDDSDLSTLTVTGFLPNGYLVTTSTLWGELGIKINVLDISAEVSIISQFDIKADTDVELGEGLSSGFNINVVDSLIAAGNNTRYRLRFFDQHGNPVKIINRNFDRIVRPAYYQRGGARGIRSFGGLKAPLQLENGYMLVKLSWPVNIKNPDDYFSSNNPPEVISANSIDLFDQNGDLLYSIEETGSTIPDIGQPAFVDQNGKLYTTTDFPYPQVRRYSVKLHK